MSQSTPHPQDGAGRPEQHPHASLAGPADHPTRAALPPVPPPPTEPGAPGAPHRTPTWQLVTMGVAPVAIAAIVGLGVVEGMSSADPTGSVRTGVTAQQDASSDGTDTSDDTSSSDGSGSSDATRTLPDGMWGGPGGGGLTGPDQDGSALGGGAQSDAVAADADQQVGVVTITSTLGYAQAESAGTGMVLTADGLVLTNNHVIDGATEIEVTVESTGTTYAATVVGTAPDSDVALLQLEDASGLTPVTIDDDGGVDVGDQVTAVGNAEGTGDLVAAAGTVTATEQTMTASTDGTDSETLSGLVQLQADVVSGDSGGPVLDDEGEVVGMTTAASSGGVTTVAYAIDVQDALVLVRQIRSGDDSGGVTIGYPAFLGVSLATGPSGAGSAAGATIAGVVADTPAAEAGLEAGDTVTAVDGTAVSSGDELSSVLAGYAPGDEVTLTWTSGSTGGTQTATVTLVQGPAD
ncbi:S1C family serine protease [Cellulomonas gilvus]|uniref:PDZ/DHR/GLGF domain protein n=1 Tax=Cellulomonas gilvus (strain ATCC 13127 / NRRL B-14078) TaxID=593907 RepID=F8A110_CELGA|nr:trypsin-like peptidase domain-containing protein [Cellulomonas gilvus]AEI12768.1 PDZ/DHR/GLGF domain protein [Cellulomonas gilvus ATCC 13127]